MIPVTSVHRDLRVQPPSRLRPSLTPAAERLIRDAAQRGPVVYALRRTRLWRMDLRALDQALVRAGLPRPRGDALRWLDDPPAPLAPDAQIVPLSLLWGAWPFRAAPGRLDRWAGDDEDPGLLRALVGALGRGGRARVLAGAPLDPAERSGASWAELARLLDARISAARQAAAGPIRVSAATLRARALADPRVQACAAEGDAAEARRRYTAIAADPIPGSMDVSLRVVMVAMRRIFEGFEVDEAGVEALRAAAAQGPLLLAPAHRSHLDYLLILKLLIERDLAPPTVAAGQNLAFFPLSWIMRTGNAFFIRRSQTLEGLSGAVLSAYLTQLVQHGQSLKIYLEGGRTRTGRVGEARLGLLSIAADAAVSGAAPGLRLVPLSVGYERVLEAGAVTAELEGRPKRPEGLHSLVSAASLLWRRDNHGYVNVQIGAPIRVADFLAAHGYGRPGQGPERKAAIAALGAYTMAQVRALTALTPTALLAAALVDAPADAALPWADLTARARALAADARARGARLCVAGGPVDDNANLTRAAALLTREGVLTVEGAGADRRVRAVAARGTLLRYYANLAEGALGDVRISSTHGGHPCPST